MSIKGSSYTWFKKALDRGDLATVRSELADLPPLTLEDALSVALLICDHEPENASAPPCGGSGSSWSVLG